MVHARLECLSHALFLSTPAFHMVPDFHRPYSLVFIATLLITDMRDICFVPWAVFYSWWFSHRVDSKYLHFTSDTPWIRFGRVVHKLSAYSRARDHPDGSTRQAQSGRVCEKHFTYETCAILCQTDHLIWRKLLEFVNSSTLFSFILDHLSE